MTLFTMPGHLIRRLQQQSNQVFQEQMKQQNLDITSVQFAAMQALNDEQTLNNDKGLEQSQIAAQIAYDKATIGGVIDRLEKKGYVSRTPSPTDKRAKIVQLTDEGKALFAELLPVVQTIQLEILHNLTDIERQQFMALASKALK